MMDDYDIQHMTNRDLAMALQFAVLAPTDPDALKIIKESVRRLKRAPDEDKEQPLEKGQDHE